MIVAPSILDVRDEDIESKVSSLALCGADWIHLDVIDWNRTPAKRNYNVDALKKARKKPYNVHLMVDDVQKYVDKYAPIASHITIQGTKRDETDLEEQVKRVNEFGIPAGIALNPDELIYDSFPVLMNLHHVLVMSVYSGYGGQKFIVDVVDKLKELNEVKKFMRLNFFIGVDGGICGDNIELIRPYADYVVAGSYILKSSDFKDSIQKLKGKKIQ